MRYISASALVADPAYLESIATAVNVTIRGCGPIAARMRRIAGGRLVVTFRHQVDLEPILHPRKADVLRYIPDVADRPWRPMIRTLDADHAPHEGVEFPIVAAARR